MQVFFIFYSWRSLMVTLSYGRPEVTLTNRDKPSQAKASSLLLTPCWVTATPLYCQAFDWWISLTHTKMQTETKIFSYSFSSDQCQVQPRKFQPTTSTTPQLFIIVNHLTQLNRFLNSSLIICQLHAVKPSLNNWRILRSLNFQFLPYFIHY